MEAGSSPASVTSQCRIKYRKSSWRVHKFEVRSGEVLCKVAALSAEGWLLVWLGAGRPRLAELALAMPPLGQGQDGAAAVLVGTDGAAPALARRLARRLARPVYVCLGATFDRFTAPLVERGLVAEIKSRPECFSFMSCV